MYEEVMDLVLFWHVILLELDMEQVMPLKWDPGELRR
jgi:hypothetical protein